jgi:hypothetical protein
MGRKQAQALLAALISTPIAAQDNLLVNGGFQQGLSGWSESGPGGVYDGCGPAGGYCYVFSYATGVVQQTVTTQANYTGFIVGFEYRLPCNNSIGGYCANPNGPVDWLTANLNLYLGGEPVQSVPLLSVQSYQPDYAMFSLTGTAPEFNTATITFTGQDVGFWAGPYGPQIDRVSLSFENPPPPPPPPEPEPEPVVTPPAAIDPAPDVAPDPTQDTEDVVQSEPMQEAVVEEPVTEMASEVVEETVSEEITVSDDMPVEQEENQAEDANDEPLSPDQLQALSAIEQSSPPTEEDVSQATEAVAQEAQAAEAARVEQQASPDQTAAISTEVHRDRNVDFFQREAIEDADTFSRETVLQASAQNIAMLMQADAQDAQTYGEQTTTEVTGEGYYFGIVDGPTFLPPPTTGMVERVEDVVIESAPAQQQEVASAPQAEQSPSASLAVSAGVDVTPAGQAQQMEILNMAGLQGEMSAGPVVDVGDVNTGDGEAMAQLAVIPAGYSSYTQARIPDAPFYQPRDIYKNRRIPDANLALYRMMQGQDRVWNDMVEDQYE